MVSPLPPPRVKFVEAEALIAAIRSVQKIALEAGYEHVEFAVNPVTRDLVIVVEEDGELRGAGWIAIGGGGAEVEWQ